MKNLNKKIKIQINSKNFRKGKDLIPVGSKIIIEIDKKGLPVDTFWRKRLEEAKIDNSLSVIKKDKTINNKAIKKENNNYKENK